MKTKLRLLPVLGLAVLIAVLASASSLRAVGTETEVSGAAAGVFPAGATFNGIPLSGSTIGFGVVISTDGSAVGDFQTVLAGTSSLGPQEITLEGKASTGTVTGATATFSGTATLDMGLGAPPTSVPFSVAATMSGLQLSGTLAAGPPSVALGTADSYGVLAGDTITNTGATTISGDLGLHPGTAVTGAPTVIGASNVNNPAAQQAKADLRAAYLDAAGRTGAILVAGGALGNSTLAPGLYKDDGAPASLGLAGGQTLMLQGDASSVWIFQSASTLITEVGSRIELSGGALPCNVFWQVGSSATLKVGTTFVGTVLAHTSITAQTGVTVAGRLFAGASPSGAGALTLDTDTITKTHCATAAEAATSGLHLTIGATSLPTQTLGAGSIYIGD